MTDVANWQFVVCKGERSGEVEKWTEKRETWTNVSRALLIDGEAAKK